MIRPERIAALLLAGGTSHRFGNEDKLIAPFMGRPLAAHARDAISSLKFAYKLAVVRAHAPILSTLLKDGGFSLVENPVPGDGLASSIRLGVAAVASQDVDALLVCLGDMPGINAMLLSRMCALYDPKSATLVCSDGKRRTPPALIGRDHFDELTRLTGDSGARKLLRAAPTLPVGAETLLDVDRPVV